MKKEEVAGGWMPYLVKSLEANLMFMYGYFLYKKVLSIASRYTVYKQVIKICWNDFILAMYEVCK